MRPRAFVQQLLNSWEVLRQPIRGEFKPAYLTGVSGSGTTLATGLLVENLAPIRYLNESALSSPGRSPLCSTRIDTHASIADYCTSLLISGDNIEAVRNEQRWLYQESAQGRGSVVLDKAPNAHMVRVPQLTAAYPDCKFILVFRDPVASVEGLRRKWPLFGDSEIEDVVDFWKRIHLRFLEDINKVGANAYICSYEGIVNSHQKFLDSMGSFLKVSQRQRRKKGMSFLEGSGKALRSVTNDGIKIISNANEKSKAMLGQEEVARINDELAEVYAELCRLDVLKLE